jgi:hypothetical protein
MEKCRIKGRNLWETGYTGTREVQGKEVDKETNIIEMETKETELRQKKE